MGVNKEDIPPRYLEMENRYLFSVELDNSTSLVFSFEYLEAYFQLRGLEDRAMMK